MMERFDILSNLIEIYPDSDHFPEHGSRGDGAGRGNRFCRKFLYDPQTFKGVRNIGGCCRRMRRQRKFAVKRMRT